MMAEKAGAKSFAFTEIGYSSSAENNSSEQLQKQFVETMFEMSNTATKSIAINV